MLSWLKYGLVTLVGCSFLGMIGYALWMREEIQKAQLEPQLISAPDTPVKRRPEEPGGMVIPNRDKLVFDLLDSSGTVDISTGVAGVNAPAPMDDAVSETDTPVVAPATPVTTPVTTANQTASPVADQIALANIAATAANSTGTVRAAGAGVPTNTAPMVYEKIAAPVQPAQVKTAIVKTPVVAARPVSVAPRGGNWGVQVGAVNAQADADALIGILRGKYPVLKGLTAHISAVKSGTSTRYRVQFTGVADRAAAAKVCSQLGGKQPCFPVGK